jgi:RimJ/RimL family protein N-acetyltransferase
MGKRDRRIVLETSRLAMRQFTENDVDNLFDLNSDPQVMRYVTGGRPTPREEVRDRIIPFHLAAYGRLDRLGTWAAETVAAGEFLGWFHFRPGPDGDVTNIDLGYRLRRSAWNKGYATEGSRALISMGFTDLGVERVFAHAMTVNTASRRVLEKCGLTLLRTIPYEGTDVIEGAEHGEVEYALTRTQWESRAAGAARNLRSRSGTIPARDRGPMLGHREMDDQVHPDHTTRLADRLAGAGEDVELFLVPGPSTRTSTAWPTSASAAGFPGARADGRTATRLPSRSHRH